MKIALTFEGSYLVLPAEKAQPLIEALAAGQLYDRNGWEDDKATYTPVENNKKTKVLFVTEDQFVAAPEPISKLNQELNMANRRWVEAYQAQQAAEARVKELETKLSSIGVAINGEGSVS